MESLRFAQMLVSRLCHDLITPIGAVASGLEILEDPGNGAASELLGIIQHSASTASKRLVFYRTVFGYSSAAHFKGLQDVAYFLKEYLSGTKVTLDWALPLQPSFLEEGEVNDAPDWGRLIGNVVLLMCEVAPKGGVLNLQISRSPQPRAQFLLKGALVPLRENIRKTLLGDVLTQNISVHEIQAYLTNILIEKKGLSLETLESTHEHLQIVLS